MTFADGRTAANAAKEDPNAIQESKVRAHRVVAMVACLITPEKGGAARSRRAPPETMPIPTCLKTCLTRCQYYQTTTARRDCPSRVRLLLLCSPLTRPVDTCVPTDHLPLRRVFLQAFPARPVGAQPKVAGTSSTRRTLTFTDPTRSSIVLRTAALPARVARYCLHCLTNDYQMNISIISSLYLNSHISSRW